ncbi:MAG: serine/threonine-protein kinase [Acidobacteriaceae bacterium]|nr:serine/threonine-protein kinase [Acidobacteriaceae bacterium]
MTAIAEDSEQGLWVVTSTLTSTVEGNSVKASGGIYRVFNGRVEKIMNGGFESVVLAGKDVMLATRTSDHRLEYNDLFRFHKQGTQWNAELLLQHQAGTLTVDHQGSILFPCPTGWCELSREQVAGWLTFGTSPLKHRVASGGDALHIVLRDRFGCVWARSFSRGFVGCNKGDVVSLWASELLGPASTYLLQEGPDGRVLAFTSGGLFYGRPDAYHVLRSENGLPDAIRLAFAAQDGTLWMAGWVNGFYRVPYPFQMEYWTQRDGVNGGSAIERVGGKMFYANDGIFSLDASRKSWQRLPGTQSLGTVTALHSMPDGTMYAAAFGHPISRISASGVMVATSVRGEIGRSLEGDDHGQIWMGGQGLFKIRQAGSSLNLVSQNVGHDQVNAVGFDPSHKTLWAYNDERILSIRDGRRSQISADDGLPGGFGVGMAVMSNGDLWLAQAGAHFTWLENPNRDPGKPFRVHLFKETEDIGHAYLNFIGIDHRGWLWRGTNIEDTYVADAAHAKAGLWIRLGIQDGIPVQGTGRGSFFADKDDSVWYSAGNNIVHFHPRDGFATDFSSPKVFLAGMSIGSRGPILAEANQHIPHGENLVAHIGSLQFDRRSALHLRYRLLPEQKAWQNTRGLDLPLGKPSTGNHTLQVQAQFATSSWSETIEDSFAVASPVWLSWPVLAGFCATLSIAAIPFVHWRRKQRERAAKMLPDLAELRLEALSPEVHRLKGRLLNSRYEVGRILARGGFAAVVEGRDLNQSGSPCAIKIFRQELIEKEWMLRRFEQEVAALRRIHHPNVVAVLDSGIADGGLFYLVMELIDGATLRERLDAGSVAQGEIASLLRQIGNALAVIHANHICHRDLKPENFMLRRGVEPGHELVLIDFSIAIVKDPDETMFGLSRAAGTLSYMAPEQAIGYADTSTDIYSLAKILIEMLTGQRLATLLPDASMDLPDCVRELLRGLGMRLSPASIERIAQALEFDPGRRPKDANVFTASIADDLQDSV